MLDVMVAQAVQTRTLFISALLHAQDTVEQTAKRMLGACLQVRAMFTGTSMLRGCTSMENKHSATYTIPICSTWALYFSCINCVNNNTTPEEWDRQ